MSGWPTIPFRQTGTWLSGGTPTRNEPTFWGGDVPWIGTKDLKGFDLRTSSEFVTQLGAETGSRVVDPGAVLFVTRGMSLAKEFRVGVAATRLAFNQDVKAIVPRAELDGRFLAWFLRSKEQYVLDQCDTATHGTKRLPLERVETMPVPLPPLSEQRRIAAILDEADALRRKRREALGLLDALLRSAFLEMFGDPVTNPREWETKALGRVCDITTGNTPSRLQEEYFGDHIEWVKSDNINTPAHYLTKAREGLSETGAVAGRVAPPGSVLMTCIAGSPGCIGNVAISNRTVAFNQQINALTPREGVTTAYLYAVLLYGKQLIQAMSTESMKGMVSKGRLESVRVPVPGLPAQLEWSHAFDYVCVQGEYQWKQCKLADELFNSLLHRAFAVNL